MKRNKTLSLSLIAAAVAASALTAHAQLSLSVSSDKSYRQTKKSFNFQGGTFGATLLDGSITYIAGCEFFQNIPAGYYIGLCAPGTTGYITSGSIKGLNLENPYLLVVGLRSAVIVEPQQPKLVKLIAAPASLLPRPEGGFEDSSVSLYYNLQAPIQQQYLITRYSTSKAYKKNQRDKFEKEIVPGTYRYSFPRLGNPNIPAPISALINPMPEGLEEKAGKRIGFEFTSVNENRWSKNGFMELKYNAPNIIKWRPLTVGSVFTRADLVTFAVRVLEKSNDPNSKVDLVDNYNGKAQSIFPDYATQGDPKILLPNPFTSSFVLPPVFAGGTRGLIEVKVNRNLNTGGVAYDFSTRSFEIPVTVVNRYSDYAEKTFLGKTNPDILKDNDGDGYNNLNEWVLESNANDATNIPLAPVAASFPTEFDTDYFSFRGRLRIVRRAYFGFTVQKKLGTNPDVVHTLQRSLDRGKTWKNFRSGYYFTDGTYSETYVRDLFNPRDLNWIVKTVKLAPGQDSLKENAPAREEIRVESGYDQDFVDGFFYGTAVRPPGTENEIYRVKVTLKKKK